MEKNIRVLFIEDSEDDALILQNEIRRGGYEPATLRVESADDMRRALDYTEWDLIISDERMPRFNAIEALKISIESGKDIPFIIVSGKIKEEAAVAAMKSGAQDYISKNNLKRLVPAIERELADAVVRKTRRRMELTVQKSQARYRMLFEKMMDAFALYEDVRDENGRPADFMYIDVNDAFAALIGVSHDILIGKTIREINPADSEELMERFSRVSLTGDPDHFEYYSTTFQRYFEVSVYRPRVGLVASIIKDVSSKKIAAGRQELVNHILQTINRENNTQTIIQDVLSLLKNHYSFDAVAIRLKQGDDFPYFLYNGFSENFIETASLLCSRNESGEIVRDDDGKPRYECLCGLVITGNKVSGRSLLTKGGSFWTNSISELLDEAAVELSDIKTNNHCLKEGYETLSLIPLRSGDDTIGLLQLNDRRKNMFTYETIEFLESVGLTVGIALKRRRTEDDIRISEERYRTIIEGMEEGYYEEDLAGNFTFLNESMCLIYGYPRNELMGMNYKRYTNAETAKNLLKIFNKIYRKSELCSRYTYELIRKDGCMRYIEASASLIKDASNKPIGFRGIVRDVTERTQMEDALRQSEERYRTIIENMEDGYFEVDLAGKFTFVNDGECRNLGYPREELIGMNNQLYANEKSAKELYRLFNEIYKTGIPVKAYDLELIKKDGTLSYDEISASLIRDSEGKPIGFRGISRDITERKQMEDALRQSEEKYRTILEEIQEGYFENDLAGNLTFFNDSACRIWGRTRNEFMGMNYKQYRDKETAKKVYQAFAELYRTGEPIKALDEEIIRKDGTKVFTEMSASLIKNTQGEPIGFRGMTRDITDRKRAEEARRESEERFTKAFRAVPEGLVISQIEDGKILEVNDSWNKIFGYSREEVIGQSSIALKLFQNPAERQHVIALLHEHGFLRDFELQIRRKSGEQRTVLLSGEFLKIQNEQYILSIIQDITERKRAEEIVRDSEARYRALFQGTADGILIADIESRMFRYANPAICRLFGYSEAELQTMSVADVHPKADLPAIMAEFEAQARGDKTLAAGLPCLRKDGTIVYADVSAVAMSVDGRACNVGFFRDITERKLNENRVLASLREKEALLKEIHHRVKNNLQVISSLMGLQSSHIKKGQDAQVALQNMQNRIKSMAIVHEKLYQSQNLSSIDFQEYIKSIIANIFQSLLHVDSRIRLNVDAEPVNLGIDRAVPCGLIFNELITNAIKHAFPAGRGGEITAGIRRSDDGRMTMFVKDDGIGLPDHFDIDAAPTLGIKLVRILTQQIGGDLIAKTDNGTTFTITFKDDEINKI